MQRLHRRWQTGCRSWLLNVRLLNVSESGKACQISRIPVIRYRADGENKNGPSTPEHVSRYLRQNNNR